MGNAGRKSLTPGGGESPRTSLVWTRVMDADLNAWWSAKCPDAKTRSAAIRHGLAYLRKVAERSTKNARASQPSEDQTP